MALFTRLRTGLQKGLSPYLGDSSIYKRGGLPRTKVELNAIVGATPDNIYTFDQATGNLVDRVGTDNLVVAGTPTYNQTGPDGNFAILHDANGDEFAHTDASFMDSDSTAVGGIVIFKATASGANRSICAKFASGVGYHVRLNTLEYVQLLVDDGPNQQLTSIAFDHADSEWHCLQYKWSYTDNRAYVYSDLGSGSDGAPAIASSLTNAGYFTIGGDQYTPAGITIAYFATFTGAQAEAIDGTGIATLLALSE